MKIYVTIEPGYRDTIWCGEKLEYMTEKASKLRHTLNIVNAPYDDVNTKLMMVMGASPEWVEETIYLLETKNIKSLVISCHPDNDIPGVSYVLEDHSQAMSMSLDYLKNVCGRKRVALFGINKNDYDKIAYSNRIKMSFFEPEDMFGEGGADAGYEKFKANIGRYDTIFFVDHVIGMYIIRKMKEDGIKIPQDIFVMSVSSSKMYEITNPSVTTITMNNEYVGDQAVAMYAYLIKQKTPISVLVNIPCDLKIGESTANIAYKPVDSAKLRRHENIKTIESAYLRSNKCENDIINLESVLSKFMPIDYNIIQCMDRGMTYAETAQKLFMSEAAVKYRVNRLIKLSGTSGKAELMKLIREYIDISKLDKYIWKKRTIY